MQIRAIMRFLRANPQIAILAAITVVFGLSSLAAIVIGLLSSGQATGDGSFVIWFHVLV
jgi:hypothetical protein